MTCINPAGISRVTRWVIWGSQTVETNLFTNLEHALLVVSYLLLKSIIDSRGRRGSAKQSPLLLTALSDDDSALIDPSSAVLPSLGSPVAMTSQFEQHDRF